MSSWRDIKKETRRVGFKQKSAGPWAEGKPEAQDGVCPSCGYYDVELDKNNYCRDEDCRRERVIKALYNGEAMMSPTGTLIWTPGITIRRKF